MLTLAFPAFLVAGALAMLVPLGLHLIRRRPPGRAPLPTARFLVEDPRKAVRVSRPTDLPLLVLRMLLLLLLGLGLARPAWLPAPEGTSTVVLLDRGSAMRGDGWRAAVGEARRSLLDADGESRGELVMFDTAAVRVPRARITPALFDSLLAADAGGAAADYAAALRAISPAARELRGADSVRVRMISALADEGWSAGLAPLRRAAWPGGLDLARVPMARPATDSAAPATAELTSVTLAAPGGGFVATALAAVGMDGPRVSPSGALPAAAASVYVVMGAPSASTANQLLERARAGATLIVTPGAVAEPLRGALPWTGGYGLVRGGGALWFGAETELAGAAGRVLAGGPAEGARTVAAWEDGRPAATAKRLERGCVVFVGTELEGGELPFQAAYPAALARLARGCDATGGTAAPRPLDPGALAVLRGRGPSAVPASAVGAAGAGVPLGRWMLAAALLAALIETLLAYRRRTAG
ncbi:BatA domain-containing protein [Longimicrobium sp.]|uniref:BatA domain-containing protein n=1 Tax=Longimicrobium sp. TaxID=2029185 RepID=UPI003B3ABEF0